MDYDLLIPKILDYLTKLVSEERADYCFHNSHHTQDVVDAAQEMSDHYSLNSEEKFIVVAAAYFHDTGYLSGGAKDHEIRSAEIAEQFLKEEKVHALVIEKVKSCILATKMPQSPRNLLESILCDADLFHLGTSDFEERNKLMQQEAEHVKGVKIDKSTWRRRTIELMQQHAFHTDYAQEKLNQGKANNLESLLKKQRKSLNKLEDEADKLKKPERGIETMFRITSSNSQRLSDMADNKANILLTVNSIILSIIVAVLLKALDSNPHLIIPTVLLMGTSVSTMVLAILATIPKIPKGHFSDEEVRNKSVNLLFFGNFYKTKYNEYQNAMNKAMDDKEFLYGMLTKDVYSQGVVLGRKYQLLRIAYGIFMCGLIISVLAFCIAVLISK
ncbi:Pycsar system effector family protein [Sphingobacterium endophyticum]|uniref:Pycsar system effector family protein n=1 Tax=Sphingobacterium endophyticum TaxID=2546448 RepID=UPI0012E0D11D|nr:Pycsar system effector family protein [Sphingobacterium endophyticum]